MRPRPRPRPGPTAKAVPLSTFATPLAEQRRLRSVEWSALLNTAWLFEATLLLVTFMMPLVNYAPTYVNRPGKSGDSVL